MSSLVLVRLIGFMTVWSVWVMPKYFHISMSTGESFPGIPHMELGAPALAEWSRIRCRASPSGLRRPAHLVVGVCTDVSGLAEARPPSVGQASRLTPDPPCGSVRRDA